MIEFKGTPGEWYTDADFIRSSDGPDTYIVAEILSGKGADRSVIVAAPELLEALIKILPYAEEHCDEGPGNAKWKSSEFMEIINASEAAIAQALGN